MRKGEEQQALTPRLKLPFTIRDARELLCIDLAMSEFVLCLDRSEYCQDRERFIHVPGSLIRCTDLLYMLTFFFTGKDAT